MGLKFKWDKRKTEINRKKHNISFEEASTVFADLLSLTIPNPLHSVNEERKVIMGYSEKQRLLVVVHTEKQDTIRIISARKATAYERKIYEETDSH